MGKPVHLGTVHFEWPDLLHAIIAGLIMGEAWGDSPRVFFGVVVYWFFGLWMKHRVKRRAVKEITETWKIQIAKEGLVLVKEEDLNAKGLKAVDGGVEALDGQDDPRVHEGPPESAG